MSAPGPVLRDIHVPPAAWWPPAPGWWLLAALVVVAAGCIAWWWRRHARRRALRVVLREIDAMQAVHARDGNDAQLADAASRLLRRVAFRINPAVASQDGAVWRTFLHAHAFDAATRQALDTLAETRFRAHPALDAPRLCAALRAWCRAALRGGTVHRAARDVPRVSAAQGEAGTT